MIPTISMAGRRLVSALPDYRHNVDELAQPLSVHCIYPLPTFTFSGARMLLKSQGAGGADKDAFATVLAIRFSNRLVTKSGDYPPEATPGKAKDSYTQTLPTYPHASPTEHAFIQVINK